MDFHNELVALIPQARLWAIARTRNCEEADDLVHGIAMAALRLRHRHLTGIGLAVRLHRIMIARLKRAPRSRRMTITSGELNDVTAEPDGDDDIALRELSLGVNCLSGVQREALFMVVLQRLSYESAALIAGCSIGAMRARVRRARVLLQAWLVGEERDDAPDGHRRFGVRGVYVRDWAIAFAKAEA